MGEEHDLLTHTGPGTPCGDLMRHYWQPVALSEELHPGGAPLPVRILSEDLVLFRPNPSGRPDSSGRDEQGRPGLLGLHCAHRGADLSYGRLEDGGLRCIYHGWLYDIHGRCLEQPGEPSGSTLHERIRHISYPCHEAGGLVFAYLGPGEPPLFPNYEIFRVPDSQRFVMKYFQDCNYLQGNEGNIDPVHLSFLHRMAGGRERQGRTRADGGVSVDAVYRQDLSPTLRVEETDFGTRIFAVRNAGPGKKYLRVSYFVMPNLCAVPGETGNAGYNANWHVPIDDTHHWKYMMTFSRQYPLDRDQFRRERTAHITPNYHLLRDRGNRWLQDRGEMRERTFAGLGTFFPDHDDWATESPGPIQNRTEEHPGSTDQAILHARRQLVRAMQAVREGRDPQHVIRQPSANRFEDMVVISEVVPDSVDWATYWKSKRTAMTRS